MRGDIVEWCQKRGIVVQAYSPRARGTRFKDKILKAMAERYKKTRARLPNPLESAERLCAAPKEQDKGSDGSKRRRVRL
jgi:aryl-alcohol dehydrogenase-like predicted oxidoreductase